MAKKYIELASGQLAEREGTVSTAGAGDAGKLVALDTGGKLDVSVLPTGVGADTVTAVASENLSAGDFVNLWSNAGTFSVRKADATTNGKPADGYVTAAVTSGATATVYKDGQNASLASLTVGSTYYLATTAGGVTATPPSSANNVVQVLGKAKSATELVVRIQRPITLA